MAKTFHDDRILTRTIKLTPARLRAEPSDRPKRSYSKPGHNTYCNFKANRQLFFSFHSNSLFITCEQVKIKRVVKYLNIYSLPKSQVRLFLLIISFDYYSILIHFDFLIQNRQMIFLELPIIGGKTFSFVRKSGSSFAILILLDQRYTYYFP